MYLCAFRLVCISVWKKVKELYSRTPHNPYPSVESKMYGFSEVMGLEGYAKNRFKKSPKNPKKSGKNLRIIFKDHNSRFVKIAI